MQVNGVFFIGADTPETRFVWSAAGAVNTLAIFLKPLPNLLNPQCLSGVNLAVWHDPDIEQKVPIASNDVHKYPVALLQRHNAVIAFPGPLPGDGHDGFPRAVILKNTDLSLGCIEVAPDTRGPIRKVNPVIDQH